MRQFLCVVLAALMAVVGMPAMAQDNGKAKKHEFKPCHLMRDPVNPAGVMDWQKFCLFTTQEPTTVEMSTGHGRMVRCDLQRGVSVVTDRESGVWLKVRACFNSFPSGFKPSVNGRSDCAPLPTAPAPPPSTKASVTAQVNVPPPEPLQIQLPPPRPAVPPSLELWAEQEGHVVAKVRKNSEVTIKWSSSATDTCRAISPDSFDTHGATAGDWKTAISGTTKFVVKCTGPDGTVQKDYEVKTGIRVSLAVVSVLAAGLSLLAFSGHGGGNSGGPGKDPKH